MFTGACTKDEDCENAKIETGIDNCTSMPHYPQEELLGNSVEFTMENAATKESFEDETQLGNGQDSYFPDMREPFSLIRVIIRCGVEPCNCGLYNRILTSGENDHGKSKISLSSHRLTRYLRSCEISEL